MGKTITEKILSRSSRRDARKGDVVISDIDLVITHDGLDSVYNILKTEGISSVWDNTKIVSSLDHNTPPYNERVAARLLHMRDIVKELGITHYYGENTGIANQIAAEKGLIKPGMLIAGIDSHVITYGAFCAASTSFGFTEIAYIFANGKIWLKVPPSIKFELSGNLSRRVMSKDILLEIAKTYGMNFGNYKAFEFSGKGAGQLTMDSRMAVTKMCMAMGDK